MPEISLPHPLRVRRNRASETGPDGGKVKEKERVGWAIAFLADVVRKPVDRGLNVVQGDRVAVQVSVSKVWVVVWEDDGSVDFVPADQCTVLPENFRAQYIGGSDLEFEERKGQ